LNNEKSKRYIDGSRSNETDFEKSLIEIFNDIDFNGLSILDAGCASGGMYNILNNKFSNIFYTGIDLDKKCIDFATDKYPDGNFKVGNFLDDQCENRSFDVVIIWGWAYMVSKWKELILKATKISRKYVIFDLRLRVAGNTVIDNDLSYQYYYTTKKRNHYIVHNIYEVLAFLQIAEHSLKEIKVNIFSIPGKTSAILPLPIKDISIGSFTLIKLTTSEESKIKRFGVSDDFLNSFKVDITITGNNKSMLVLD
jgi:hypothetical protein